MTTVPEAIRGAVEAAVPGWVVFDGIVPTTPALTYAVVYPDDGAISRTGYAWQPVDGLFRWFVTSVAPTREAAAWHATQVRDYLLANRIVADGWSCAMVRHEHSDPARADEPVGPRPVVIAVNEYSLRAHRTS